ncbi:site-2 protease family protein [archaeon]|jgi:membrane-associated protease RseP (regulator of RpoE activity)|nr:site-2 protease family protein [archaeon]MBT4373204.1 site-2 protease family protein [archaeon]MBT4531549.1 site-2 protease family protein [archaeon]MBT7001273.1 site-2 protease family protein [archaeon]MBT7282241.1 site-2 protease family protein [archaeon]
MVEFIVYDLVLLALFAIFVSLFLYKNRKNLKKEGLLFLYKAGWGIKLINYVGNKYTKTLKVLSYVSIALGYVLMATMLWFLGRIVWIYAFAPDIVRAIKIPPIMPLIPYLPQAFKLDFLPPFFFIYWIVILAVIAISHEFAHGIFAAYHKIKIKSTGFGFFPFFLPVFLAAFVELDEENMQKHKKTEQMAILSAGTFANILVAIFFGIILSVFFSMAFVPGGVQFDSYAYEIANVSGIANVNGIQLENPNVPQVVELLNSGELNEITYNGEVFVGVKQFVGEEYALLYYDAPAINNLLGGIITKVNGVEILDREKLGKELNKYSAGETITLTSIERDVLRTSEISLGQHPEIVFINQESSGLAEKITKIFMRYKKPNVYYKPRWDGASVFIYNLLWWLILISISVALINMLPVGIFDGGRFFYLTVLGITGSKKIARRSFAILTQFFLLLLLVLMIFWVKSFF